MKLFPPCRANAFIIQYTVVLCVALRAQLVSTTALLELLTELDHTFRFCLYLCSACARRSDRDGSPAMIGPGPLAVSPVPADPAGACVLLLPFIMRGSAVPACRGCRPDTGAPLMPCSGADIAPPACCLTRTVPGPAPRGPSPRGGAGVWLDCANCGGRCCCCDACTCCIICCACCAEGGSGHPGGGRIPGKLACKGRKTFNI